MGRAWGPVPWREGSFRHDARPTDHRTDTEPAGEVEVRVYPGRYMTGNGYTGYGAPVYP